MIGRRTMNIMMKDDMVKESNRWKLPTILFFILAVLFPLGLIWNDIPSFEIILGEVSFLFIACYFLYGYLYTFRYKVVVTDEKIMLKTLFNNTEISLKDIQNYDYKRYRKSEFYQFRIFCNGKKILIHTRHRDDLEKLLKRNCLIIEK
jgi:hypothetical protein